MELSLEICRELYYSGGNFDNWDDHGDDITSGRSIYSSMAGQFDHVGYNCFDCLVNKYFKKEI